MLAHCTAKGQKVWRYGEHDVVLSFSRYLRNNRVCLRLLEAEGEAEGRGVAVCTVNLPSLELKENEVAIKTWSENVAMLGWLSEQGIVSEPLRYAHFADVFIPICALLVSDDRG